MEKVKAKAVKALKWSEKYTKTDMLYLAKGGFWGLISQIGLVLMTFGLAVAFARLVPKDTYGEYKYILSIVSLLSTLTLTGLGTAVMQSISRGYDGTMSYAFWKNIKWSALFFLGAGLTSVYYFLHGNSTLGISMLIAGCLWPFWNSTNLYSSLLVAKKDFRRVTIYFDILGNLFPYLCIFVTMFLTSNPVFFVAVYIVSNTLIGVILYNRVVSVYKPSSEVDPHMLGYSKHLSLMGILSGIAGTLDQILVFHYVGAAELAVYNFATAIPDQIKAPVKSLTNMIFPKMTERSDKEIRQGMANKIMILLVLSVCLIIGYIFLAPFIFRIFFPKYTDSIFYSQIYSLSLLWIVYIPADTYLNAKKKVKELYASNIFISIIQIILLFVGILWGGLLGLVIARVVIRLVSAGTSLTLFGMASKESVDK